VLSGGAGTRLRPFSYSRPKQLIPIANKPVLEYVLENIRDIGVTDIGLIVGDGADDIAEVVGDGARLGVELTYIHQDEPRGLAHCVAVAHDFLGNDDFVMYLGDNMLADGIVSIADEFRAHRPAAHVVVYKVPDPQAFGVAELAADGTVSRLVEKPRQPRSDLALVGVYFFTAAVHEAVGAIRPSARGELEITDAIQWLVASGAPVRASRYTGYWRDTGQTDDVLECNRQVLDGLEREVAGQVDDASALDGRVVIGAGAKIVRSHIVGPTIVGPNTVVADCEIGPYTSIGRDCALRETALDDSIVLDGATIADVPAMSGSLIGRSARIASDTAASTHRLVVGDDTQIELPG